MVASKVENNNLNYSCRENVALETCKHSDLEISSCLIQLSEKETPAGDLMVFLS